MGALGSDRASSPGAQSLTQCSPSPWISMVVKSSMYRGDTQVMLLTTLFTSSAPVWVSSGGRSSAWAMVPASNFATTDCAA